MNQKKVSINKPIVGITIGDINGIGVETIISVLSNEAMFNRARFVVYGSTKVLAYYKKALNNQKFQYTALKDWGKIDQKQTNVVNCIDENARIEPGKESDEAGKCALQAIDAALADIKAGKIDILVTAPINKHTVAKHTEKKFTGHTGYIAQYFEVKSHAMMLCTERLKMGLVTEHIPVQRIAEVLTEKMIYEKIKTMHASLENDFGIHRPKIGVLGLNPHAGENGNIGTEEFEIILPAINKAYRGGIYAFGPYPSDGLFGSGNFIKLDGILAMYHDQGLIAFKTIAFNNGVNFTAGLPIIRTSPDHGTAYSLVLKNQASSDSMRQAIFMGLDAYRNRKERKEAVQTT